MGNHDSQRFDTYYRNSFFKSVHRFIYEVKLTPQLNLITDIDFYSRSEIFFAISSK